MGEITIVDANIDLQYSIDDGGWYYLDYSEKNGFRVSVTYETKKIALEHYRNGQIEWEQR